MNVTTPLARGAAGTTGAQGAAGTNGTNGTNGAAGASAQILRATFATRTILQTIAATQFYTRPQNDSNYPDIMVGVVTVAATAPGTAITAGDGTNYATITFATYDAAGTLKVSTVIPISTAALANATGTIAANGTVTVTLATPVAILGGYSVQMGVAPVAAGAVTPALSVTLGV